MGKSSFLRDLKQSCLDHDIKLILKPEKHITVGKEKFGGWFDDIKKELVCAYKPTSNIQLEILVHESCHLDQYIAQTEIWKKANKHDAWSKFNDLLDGKPFTKKQIDSFIGMIQMVERECEEMSVEKIKKYNLNIDINRYRAKANSYILFYTLIKETKKWINKKAPYKYKSIIDRMPSNKIISDFTMSPELKNMYIDRIYL